MKGGDAFRIFAMGDSDNDCIFLYVGTGRDSWICFFVQSWNGGNLGTNIVAERRDESA